ncbi:MAG: type restriction endonuclease subunit [Edaphobacter sp.]|nr:type restriction endonuclease subunit [Edaphobacter sp.]
MESINQISLGSPVSHASFGRGVVEYSKGETTLVRFSTRIEECLTSELTMLRSPAIAYLEGQVAPASPVVLRLLAETIGAVNDAWGVFSPSRIDLYPHQLWVCRKVTESWPVRWVVADDVGLGKTIEAGLILWRLFRLGLVRRLLILCPASLVQQWQQRLFTMFDIRTAQYDPDQDTEKVDFWKLNPHVVASFHTLREGREGRHDRMLKTDPWDLIIVDEAHHLNFDEASGMTLAHRLIKKLQDAEQLSSIIFFTGTPHRGKHFGFLALMSLVRPDLFDPRKPVDHQLTLLPQALIRNNKYHVTNLRGERLFKQPVVNTIPYHYNEVESRFYQMMTEFIGSGRAYATRLDGSQGRAVMLVLIALQKLASSSVAAVRSALQKRLTKLQQMSHAVQGRRQAESERVAKLESLEDDVESYNLIAEEEISKLSLELMENECDRLNELIAAADLVTAETKIDTIVQSIRQLPSGESVLLFTEYKITQALLLSALWREFGEASATFINGDDALPDVLTVGGAHRPLHEQRENAKDRFNSGEVRFLVSTEAAGEGIDLQERCSRLIHVDLPWNPMRLHQRVGRLNRIGQNEVVKVMLFQNPDTVESRIWDLLNEKLERIRQSINSVTEEPEDLHQLILGIARPGMLDTVFSQAQFVPREKLDQWFDSQSGQMGGEDAVRVVQDLLGHAQHFDFAQVSDRIPKFDLPDLAPFLRLALRHNRRQLSETDGILAFKTPEAWQKVLGVKPRYDDLHFERRPSSRRKGAVLGVGNRLFDAALSQAGQFSDTYAVTAVDSESGVLFVFRCYDRITGNVAQPKTVVYGVHAQDNSICILNDGQVLKILNELAGAIKSPTELDPIAQIPNPGDPRRLEQAEALLRDALSSLDLPFRQPEIELVGILAGVGNSLALRHESST